jgi:uncharacterized hydrophobic protein (TIGR00341 family)
MNLRLLKIFLPLEEKLKADEILRKASVDHFWHDRISDKKVLIRALVTAEDAESFLDELEAQFSEVEDFRTVIIPVEASIPRMKEKEEIDNNNDNPEEVEKKPNRVSREELYNDISTNSKLNWVYVALIILASIIGAVGLVRGNIPMVVGAMIIAPLLGPAAGLSLGTVLGDFKLTFKALKTLFIGVILSLIFSVLVGFIFTVNPNSPEFLLRTQPDFGDVIVSLASGTVGALSFTTGTLTSLAGVMVAVSLLPPLIAAGMLLGAGFIPQMGSAFLLFLINIICINLAGTVTFLIQKISPRTKWDTYKAKFLTVLAVSIWILLLILAVGILFYY